MMRPMAREEDVRNLALALPETTEKPCYGTPGFYVKGKLFARIREDNTTVAVKCDKDERDALVASSPKIYSVTPHYQSYPMVLITLSAISKRELEEMLTDAWRFTAPKRVLAAFDAARG
jgi:hypothetical protein